MGLLTLSVQKVQNSPVGPMTIREFALRVAEAFLLLYKTKGMDSEVQLIKKLIEDINNEKDEFRVKVQAMYALDTLEKAFPNKKEIIAVIEEKITEGQPILKEEFDALTLTKK